MDPLEFASGGGEWRGLGVVILWGVLLLPAAAQSGNRASVEGILTDPSGRPVSGARLDALQVATGTHYITTSNDHGIYRFPALPVGIYELRVEHEGLATIEVPRLDVLVGAHVDLPLTFSLSTVAMSVTVVDVPPLIESSRSQQSTTLDNRLLSSLPVNGRDFAYFSLMTPGVNADARGGLSFGGQRGMNSLLVDGINNDDPYWGQPNSGFDLTQFSQADYHISLEAIQEFQVNANTYSAELGRAGGGVINAVIKSGTNEFHGSAFWFYRDRSLNANDTITKAKGFPKPPYHFNQAGGTAGGPIMKNRLFFFGGYDALRSETANTVILNLPPGFQLDSDPTVAGYQQLALNYLGARAYSWHQPFSQDDYLARVDWQLAGHSRLHVSWDRQNLLTGLAAGNPQTSFERADRVTETSQIAGGSLTSVFGSTVNDVRAAYVGSDEPWDAIGINPEAIVFEGGEHVLVIGRAPGRPQEIRRRGLQVVDTLSLQRGRHEWKFGADIALTMITYLNAVNFTGSYQFQSLAIFGRSLAGDPVPPAGESFQQAFSGLGTPGSITHPDMQQYAAFAEDTWRARSNLTLHLGVRYDFQDMASPAVKNPSPALAAAGIDTSLIPSDRNNFAPRIGLSWSPGDTHRLVVRAGFGIFYAPTPAVLAVRAHFLNGISVQLRTFNADTPATRALIPAYPDTLCGPPDPNGSPPSCPPPAIGGAPPVLMAFSPTFRQPYVQQGSLGVEGAVTRDVAVSAAYLFFKGTHLQRVRDVNLGTPTVDTAIGVAGSTGVLAFQKFTLPRPMEEFDRVLMIESAASSIYHGLAVQVRKNYSHGFQIMGAYTLSKVIDDNPNVYAINPGVANSDSSLVADPSNPGADRAPGDNDQRQRLVLGGVLDIPSSSSLPSLARHILSNWQLSGILTAQSGMPYSGLVHFDLNNDGNTWADRTPGLGRNTFHMPATVSFSPRITRIIPLSNGAQLMLSWEAFNALNRSNIYDVNRLQYAYTLWPAVCGIAGTPCLSPLSSFGTPLVAAGPRIIQFSVRFVF
jgi:hypothetical protein